MEHLTSEVYLSPTPLKQSSGLCNLSGSLGSIKQGVGLKIQNEWRLSSLFDQINRCIELQNAQHEYLSRLPFYFQNGNERIEYKWPERSINSNVKFRKSLTKNSVAPKAQLNIHQKITNK